MKSFSEWLKDNGEELPKGNISGTWFVEHGLPMIVECTCCGTTMTLPSAFIDNEGYTSCKGDD